MSNDVRYIVFGLAAAFVVVGLMVAVRGSPPMGGLLLLIGIGGIVWALQPVLRRRRPPAPPS